MKLPAPVASASVVFSYLAAVSKAVVRLSILPVEERAPTLAGRRPF